MQYRLGYCNTYNKQTFICAFQVKTVKEDDINSDNKTTQELSYTEVLEKLNSILPKVTISKGFFI